MCHCWEGKPAGPRFNIKMPSYQYRKSHCGDKTIVRSSYLHNGISYTGKTTSLYWIRALEVIIKMWVKYCCKTTKLKETQTMHIILGMLARLDMPAFRMFTQPVWVIHVCIKVFFSKFLVGHHMIRSWRFSLSHCFTYAQFIVMLSYFIQHCYDNSKWILNTDHHSECFQPNKDITEVPLKTHE